MLTRLERFCARRRLGNEWKLEVNTPNANMADLSAGPGLVA